MLMKKVGLVDMTGKVDAHAMSAAVAAVNIQVTRDLPQFWPINATVEYLPDRHHIPQGVWPVQIVDHLPAGEGGFHQTRHGQPYAKIVLTPSSNEWTVDFSHETLEMLVDPSGNRLQTSGAIGIDGGGQIKDVTGRFEYLVEACDPCEADDFTYLIDGVSVSDFITPHFYDPKLIPGTRYSFTGAISRPREILKGGYISFLNPTDGELQQILWVDPNEPPQLVDLGPAPKGMSLRVFVENKTRQMALHKRAGLSANIAKARKADREKLAAAATARAKHYV
jgi:hypothetical protein